MKKVKGFKDCEFEDLDPFNNCRPVNCELKYFGKRNFFKNPNCVPAKICNENDDAMYDYETNECSSFGNVLSQEELEEIEMGKIFQLG